MCYGLVCFSREIWSSGYCRTPLRVVFLVGIYRRFIGGSGFVLCRYRGRCFEILGGVSPREKFWWTGWIPNIVSHGMSNGNISVISRCLAPSVMS